MLRLSRIQLRCALAAVLLLMACVAPERPRLLLLITLDTMRADHIGAYGNQQGLTPNLDSLAAESLRFTNAFAPASYTLPSMASLMSGRYPEEVGIYENRSLFSGKQLMLAEVLRVNGWTTGAVVSNYVLRSGTGMETGFDRYDDEYTHSEANREQPERMADRTTGAAFGMIDKLGDDAAGDSAGVFLWLHYQDPHGPYLPPGDRRERFLDGSLSAEDGQRELEPGGMNPRGAIPDYQLVGEDRRVGYYRAGYAGEVAYLDEELGRLFEGLEGRGWLADASIVVTADHGESLGENDYWFAHGELLSDPLVRLPLLVRHGESGRGTRDDVVTTPDLFATLLAVAGVGAPTGYIGRNLIAEGASDSDSVAYMATLMGSSTKRYGIVADGYKYVHSRIPGRGIEEIVEPLDGRVGGEISAKTTEGLRAKLAAFRATLNTREPGQAQALSPHDREMLRKLGYLDDEPDR